jgi:hypothetical protein
MSAQTQTRENLLTPEGYEALLGELTEPTLVGRARVADELQRAREMADDTNANMELLEARREHELLEARTATVEESLRGRARSRTPTSCAAQPASAQRRVRMPRRPPARRRRGR